MHGVSQDHVVDQVYNSFKDTFMQLSIACSVHYSFMGRGWDAIRRGWRMHVLVTISL
jgi:hypothetical protein